ncbi:hypothetical protein C8R47DRAFT_1121530 [Mycena vitilis]|nr:hypothetical protein C8R47DRAFT_1121530 [Mycena vitilis]
MSRRCILAARRPRPKAITTIVTQLRRSCPPRRRAESKRDHGGHVSNPVIPARATSFVFLPSYKPRVILIFVHQSSRRPDSSLRESPVSSSFSCFGTCRRPQQTSAYRAKTIVTPARRRSSLWRSQTQRQCRDSIHPIAHHYQVLSRSACLFALVMVAYCYLLTPFPTTCPTISVSATNQVLSATLLCLLVSHWFLASGFWFRASWFRVWFLISGSGFGFRGYGLGVSAYIVIGR